MHKRKAMESDRSDKKWSDADLRRRPSKVMQKVAQILKQFKKAPRGTAKKLVKKSFRKLGKMLRKHPKKAKRFEAKLTKFATKLQRK